ncbi:P-type ATPase [Amycolatopsis sp. NPDC005003]
MPGRDLVDRPPRPRPAFGGHAASWRTAVPAGERAAGRARSTCGGAGATVRNGPGDAAVVRDGVAQRIPAARLVPGDVVELAAGDRVPICGHKPPDAGIAPASNGVRFV